MTITLRSVKGSALTHGELDGNFTDLQNQLDNAAIAYDPVTITADTTLVASLHANRLLICNSASPITLTLQSDALGGFDKDDSINAVQYGTGAVSFSAGTATLQTVSGTSTTTLARYRFIGAVRGAANTWLPTELSGGGSGGTVTAFFDSGPSGYFLPERFGTTQISGGGISFSNSGTLSSRSIAATSAITKRLRVGYTGTAAANALAGPGAAVLELCYFDEVPVVMETCFCTADAIASGAKMFIGFYQGSGGTFMMDAGQDPGTSTSKQRIGISLDSTDQQLKFVHKGTNAPVATVINGGAGFPGNTNAADLYRVRIEYFPVSTGQRKVTMTLTNLITAATATLTVTAVGDIPQSTVGQSLIIQRSSGANVVAPILDFYGVVLGKFA